MQYCFSTFPNIALTTRHWETMNSRQKILAFVGHRLGTMLWVLLFALTSGTACIRLHDDLPASELAKAKQVRDEKRKEYDVLFFNEFASHNHTRGRGTFEDCKRRELFRQMAQEGYEGAVEMGRSTDDARHQPTAATADRCHRQCPERGWQFGAEAGSRCL